MNWNTNSNNSSNFVGAPSVNNCNTSTQPNSSSRILLNPNESAAPYELYQGASQTQQCYRGSLRGTIQNSETSNIFFSQSNVNYIQNRIIQEVYLQSNGQYQIGRQSDLQLQIIMRSTYLSYSKNLLCNQEQQVAVLNEKVIAECVKLIIPEIQQYLGYRHDISTPRCLLSYPVNTSDAGTKLGDLSKRNDLSGIFN
tara:strand:- start:170 stop:760 length:591 start_codon:yes stop_codon:yes gene_type:complete